MDDHRPDDDKTGTEEAINRALSTQSLQPTADEIQAELDKHQDPAERAAEAHLNAQQEEYEIIDYLQGALSDQDTIINKNTAQLEKVRAKRAKYAQWIAIIKEYDENAAEKEATLVNCISAAEFARAQLNSGQAKNAKKIVPVRRRA